ncbi:MAG: hypothetical protein QM704_15485 [Anaeromyxobacteraceae bacterium]
MGSRSVAAASSGSAGIRPALSLLGILLLAAVAIACGGGGKKTAPDDRPMLEKLNVPTNLPPRTDAATVHPLGKRNTIYQRRTELYLSGVKTTDATHFLAPYLGRRQVLLDDGKATPAYGPLFTNTSDETWTSYNAASCAADLDGDGREEVLVLYQNRAVNPMKTFLRVIRRVGAGYEQSAEYELADNLTFSQRLGPYSGLMIASGDLDGDAKDELALVAGGHLVVLRYAPDQFLKVLAHDYQAGTDGQVTTLAIGNVDTDPLPELVVMNGVYGNVEGTMYLYRWNGTTLAELSSGTGFTPKESTAAGGRSYGYARVAIGDLDGDHLNEIVLAGEAVPYTSTMSVTAIGYDPVAKGRSSRTTLRVGMSSGDWEAQWLPAVAVLDADGPSGGAKKEVLAYRYILGLDADGNLAHKWSGLVLPVAYWDKVITGDFNGDARDEVAFVSNDQWLQLWGYGSGSFHELKRIDIDADAHHTTLTGVNMDDDSTVLQYEGGPDDYGLLYSNPQILAVLASPPYYQGQDTGDAVTSFEWEASSEDESQNTYGFYAGIAFGYSAETPFWGSAGSSEFKVTVDASMDWNYSQGWEQSAARSFDCPPGENQVVFVSTPIDVYRYKIVSSPVAAQVGTYVTVQIPRTPKIIPMEVDLYNAAVPEELRVPAAALPQAFGDPWSYPKRTDMLALFSDGPIRNDEKYGDYKSVIPVSVTQGGFRTPDPFRITTGYAGGGQGISLSQGYSKGFGSEFNLQVGVEFQNVAGGVLVGGKAGFHYGYAHSYRSTDKTTISGWIPNIPSGKKPYTAGLFAYPYPTAANARFVVVNYWVEE